MVNQYIEKYGIKIQVGVAIVALIFIVVTTYNMTRFTESMRTADERVNARVDHLSDKYVTIRADIDRMQTDSSDIKTQLSNIQTILIRVEAKIKGVY